MVRSRKAGENTGGTECDAAHVRYGMAKTIGSVVAVGVESGPKGFVSSPVHGLFPNLAWYWTGEWLATAEVEEPQRNEHYTMSVQRVTSTIRSVACSYGSRLVITLLGRLEREAAQGRRLGLASMCVGVGQGAALLVKAA